VACGGAATRRAVFMWVGWADEDAKQPSKRAAQQRLLVMCGRQQPRHEQTDRLNLGFQPGSAVPPPRLCLL